MYIAGRREPRIKDLQVGGIFPIWVVGLGLSSDDMTASARAAVDRAEVLAGGRRLLDRFPRHPGERIVLASPLEPALSRIAEAREQGRRTVVLADGDPLLFGVGETLLRRLGPEALRIVPGLGALQTACARLGRSPRDIPAVSLHGRNDFHPLFSALQTAGRAAVFTDAKNTPALIAGAVRKRGGDAFDLHVLENLGNHAERHVCRAVRDMEGLDFASPNLVLVERTSAPETPLSLGLPDDGLARMDGVYTKAPVRAVSLAALAPTPGLTVWDLGAGSGAVSLEAAFLTCGGRVFAVEKDARRLETIRENIRRTGALAVTAAHGEAPDCLAALPDPDRVFIGGGLGRDNAVLQAAWERLGAGGALVANVVLLDSLHRTRRFLEEAGVRPAVTQIAACESAPLAGDLRFRAGNPVFVVYAKK